MVETWWSESHIDVSPSRGMFGGGSFVPMKLPCTASSRW
jgi:hypothetical protein